MKKWIAAALVLLMTACPAVAEGLAAFETYAGKLADAYGGEWKEDGDVRILKAGESATVSACLSGEDVVAVTVEAQKDGELRETAYAALAALDGLGSETLFAIHDMESLQLTVDGCIVGHHAGETRECIYIAPEEIFAELIWEPVHGGDQLHRTLTCSGMDVPRLITAAAGEKTGYDACDHCMKDADE